MPIIEVKGLTKKFNGRTAVDRFDLAIEQGELFGLLGPNGAGKTTTISMLSTILPPSEGTAIVCGYDIKQHSKEVRRMIGVVTQDVGLYDDLTAIENLAYFGELHGLKGAKLHKRINKLLKIIQLKNRANDRIKTLSGGMKHRINLAVGLIHEPRVLFLDEPTTGLDPQARLVIWELIKQFQAEGTTILLTTHYMEEADYLCDRIAIMDRGKIIALGTPTELKQSIGKLEVIEVKISGINKYVVSKLRKIRGVKKIVCSRGSFKILTPRANRILAQIVGAITSAGAHIDSLNIAQPTLEDVFIKLTGKTLGD